MQIFSFQLTMKFIINNMSLLYNIIQSTNEKSGQQGDNGAINQCVRFTKSHCLNIAAVVVDRHSIEHHIITNAQYLCFKSKLRF